MRYEGDRPVARRDRAGLDPARARDVQPGRDRAPTSSDSWPRAASATGSTTASRSSSTRPAAFVARWPLGRRRRDRTQDHRRHLRRRGAATAAAPSRARTRRRSIAAAPTSAASWRARWSRPASPSGPRSRWPTPSAAPSRSRCTVDTFGTGDRRRRPRSSSRTSSGSISAQGRSSGGSTCCARSTARPPTTVTSDVPGCPGRPEPPRCREQGGRRREPGAAALFLSSAQRATSSSLASRPCRRPIARARWSATKRSNAAASQSSGRTTQNGSSSWNQSAEITPWPK